MAISVGGTGGRGRRSRGIGSISEINVTPFVDVALVLLVIFMITAHAMESGIEIDVPKTKSTASSAKELPVININKDGETFLGRQPVNIHKMADSIRQRYPSQQAVYLRADRETPFDIVAQVMSELGEAKLNVSVVTQPIDAK